MKGLLRLLSAALIFAYGGTVAAQANGRLQLHYMDVGQGDGAVLISPRGEVMLFDSGDRHECEKPIAYLESLGVQEIDYHLASHYHADHIGCAAKVFAQFPLRRKAFDRGQTYSSDSYRDYVAAAGAKRSAVTKGQTITLDAGSANPVTVKIVALNGNGIATNNDDDLSVVALVSFGTFRASFSGDLSGEATSRYKDLETVVSAEIGHVDVYKVHGHCSSHSSNITFLKAIKSQVGIISVGMANTNGYPAEDCLQRLHDSSVVTFWTSAGRGAQPDPQFDTVVNGSVVVEVAPGATKYTVRAGPVNREFAMGWPAVAFATKFVWSKNSSVYHHANCEVAKRIKPQDREAGNTPPSGRRLHKDCPRLP